ncbi:tripartite tricarboxylate transporter TctB family protein [Shumkonia mesophila]|uniref:tripartite tricarboxylate transporter TctB family protein n=1 Tax=Shumkonia mesophila TaxID=2838854 RepID=UPI002934429F|nr:tripartite tricarboxylate transporter TctB family protein [Shumkonia mesophila]
MKAGDKSETGKVSVGAELIIPIASLLFAVYYLTSIWNIRWEAQVNGFFHSTILLILIVAFLIKTFARIARGEADLRFGERLGTTALLKSRLGLIGITAVFVFTLPYLGFTLGTFLFLLATMLFFGIRSRKLLILVPLCLAAGGYILFIAALNARFPRGVIENLLAAIS